MSKWYEIEHAKRDPDQRKSARVAYFQSLLATAYGRQVFADMRRRVREMDEITVKDPDYSAAVLMLDDFLRETRFLCGVTDEIAVIEAEKQIAAITEVEMNEPEIPDEFRE